MVERVARTICIAAGWNPDEAEPLSAPILPDTPGAVVILRHPGPRWQFYIPHARAVMAAMRKPTEAMVVAGDRLPDCGADQVWPAMIDVELTEP